jgi:hypothetical protein
MAEIPAASISISRHAESAPAPQTAFEERVFL